MATPLRSRYDFIAIGGGNTGLAAVNRIAAAGRKVALVDRGPVGGLCSLAGCNPKKVLVRATEVLDEVRHAGQHGIDAPVRGVDWGRVIARTRSFTDPVPEATERGLADAGVERIRGEARFLSPDSILVDGAQISADGFLIATGSKPRPLEFPGADLVAITDDILNHPKPPEDLVILGAGVVAFEFGQVFARLGSHVTFLMPSDRPLRGADETLVDALVAHSREELKIEFVAHARVRAVTASQARFFVEVEIGGTERVFEADFVLNGAGRVANLEPLNLSAAGVAADKKGVVVDAYLRSPGNRRVFAGGDAHGRRQLSPVASYEGRVTAKNFLEGDVEEANYDAIPQAVYTVPPLAWVGKTESEARQAGLKIKVNDFDMETWKVYAIAGERPARIKLVLEEGSRRILGAHLYSAGAGELINIFAMAVRFNLTAADLEQMVWAYPTFSSAFSSVLG